MDVIEGIIGLDVAEGFPSHVYVLLDMNHTPIGTIWSVSSSRLKRSRRMSPQTAYRADVNGVKYKGRSVDRRVKLFRRKES